MLPLFSHRSPFKLRPTLEELESSWNDRTVISAKAYKSSAPFSLSLKPTSPSPLCERKKNGVISSSSSSRPHTASARLPAHFPSLSSSPSKSFPTGLFIEPSSPVAAVLGSSPSAELPTDEKEMLQPLLSYEVAEAERDAARMDPPLRKAHPKSAPSSRPAYESNAPSYSSPYSRPLSSHVIFYAGHNSESKLHQALERPRHLFPTPMQRKRLSAEIIRKRNRIAPLLEEIQYLREKRADEAKNFAALQSERANLVAKIASPCNKNKSLRHQTEYEQKVSSKIGIKIVGSKSKMYFIRLEIKRKLHVVKALQAEVDALVKMLPRNSARPPHEPPIEALTEPNIQRASTAIRQSIVRREHNKVDGWELYYTPSYAYYYNHNTGESEWAETDDGPLYLETSANTANIENDASPVPITRAVSLEWELCHDLEGRPYIYNRRKNISEWVVDYAKDDTLNTFRGDGKEKYDVDNNADSEQIMPEVVLRDHDITAASDPPSTNLTLEYYEDIVEDPNDSKIYYTPEGLGYSYSKVTGLSEWVLEQMQVSS